jgi:hypothetical protein
LHGWRFGADRCQPWSIQTQTLWLVSLWANANYETTLKGPFGWVKGCRWISGHCSGPLQRRTRRSSQAKGMGLSDTPAPRRGENNRVFDAFDQYGSALAQMSKANSGSLLKGKDRDESKVQLCYLGEWWPQSSILVCQSKMPSCFERTLCQAIQYNMCDCVHSFADMRLNRWLESLLVDEIGPSDERPQRPQRHRRNWEIASMVI